MYILRSLAYIWEEKLRGVKSVFQQCEKIYFSSLTYKNQEIQVNQEPLANEMAKNLIRIAHLELLKQLEQELFIQNTKEEEEWRVKLRSLWLRLGDQNTKSFYQQGQLREHQNKFPGITQEDSMNVSSYEGLKRVAFNHYESLYSEGESTQQEHLEYLLWKITRSINQEHITLSWRGKYKKMKQWV